MIVSRNTLCNRMLQRERIRTYSTEIVIKNAQNISDAQNEIVRAHRVHRHVDRNKLAAGIWPADSTPLIV
jgi:hypothetical protein